MKGLNVLLLIMGITLISVGVGGYILATDNNDDSKYESIMMNQVWSDNDGYSDEAYCRGGYKTPGRYSYSQHTVNGEPFGLDELTHEVEEYIGKYDQALIIGDIFVFEDTEYYYSIIEENTGKGAMELLVNPYTKAIYPEYGPNMMWNLKYGMHYAGGMMRGRGMRGNRGRIGYSSEDEVFDFSDFSEDNEITIEEAYNEGMAYLEDNTDDLALGDEYHEFYGYYTFHVEENGEPIGMLSVNGFNGDVWYHDWHGELVEIISGHEDEHE